MCPSLAKAHLKMARWAYEIAKIKNFPAENLSFYKFGKDETENEELLKSLEATSLVNLEKLVRAAISDDLRAK